MCELLPTKKAGERLVTVFGNSVTDRRLHSAIGLLVKKSAVPGSL